MHRGAVPHGIPLNQTTLSRMSEEERDFWMDFLEEAARIVKVFAYDGGTRNRPWDPPESLRAKYWKAVAEYDGMQYCQVNQLSELFRF